jgi:hypothetical protein
MMNHLVVSSAPTELVEKPCDYHAGLYKRLDLVLTPLPKLRPGTGAAILFTLRRKNDIISRRVKSTEWKHCSCHVSFERSRGCLAQHGSYRNCQ